MNEEENPARSAAEVLPDAVDGVTTFRRALFAQTPRVWVTPVLVGINVAVFIVMVAAGVGLLKPSVDSLISWGANYGPRTTSGEWWRLLSSMFLHIGVFHVAMNMIGLWQIGFLVERLLGNRGFLAAYFVSGICGSVASVAWNPGVVSAGASGAVFGVYGVLIAYLLRHRGSIPKEVLQPLQRSTLFFVGLNVVYGFQVKGIDMAAHIGGLLGGFAAALVLARPLTGRRFPGSVRRELGLGVAAVAITAGAALFLPRGVDIQAEMTAFAAMERDVVQAYNGALERRRGSGLSDDAMAAIIDERVLPPWRAQQERLAKLGRLRPEQKKRVDTLVRYMDLREKGWTKFSEALRTDDRAKADAAGALLKQADAVLAEPENGTGT